MRKILHLSDIHFGKVSDRVVRALLRECIRLQPDLVIISGDLTQRARESEFEIAQDFLNELTAAGIVHLSIPGNHDIRPLYSPLRRALDPFDRFDEYVSPFTQQSYSDSEIAVTGVNTVRASKLKGGRISQRDIRAATRWFAHFPERVVRIVVTHHPLDLPAQYSRRKLAARAAKAVYSLEKSRIDLYLSGHYHRSSVEYTGRRYTKEHYTAVAVQAGTVSDRRRGELQSFNLVTIGRSTIHVETRVWNPSKQTFVPQSPIDFILKNGKWNPDI